MKETLSVQLFKTLLKGRDQLSGEAIERIAHFVLSQRRDEGAFMDKSGQPDLYYTVFGRMLSYVLALPYDSEKNSVYLANLDVDSLDLIHYAAYMRCRLIQQLMDGRKIGLLFRTFFSTKIKALEDFCSVPHNDIQSPYTQFVWLSLLEDTGGKVQRSTFNVQHSRFDLSAYRAKDGGYMNIKDGLTATTNATVAALAIMGQLDGYRDNADIRYLYDLQETSGGFAAAKASPFPDLLSTATSLFMLNCYGMKPKFAARDFIEAHWLDSGGFSATLMEDTSDVEYTFYGLLALGAINTA